VNQAENLTMAICVLLICLLEISGVLRVHNKQPENEKDRILPCLQEESDEVESCSEFSEVSPWKRRSSSYSADQAEDIASSERQVNDGDNVSFGYTAGISRNVNMFSLPDYG